MTVSVVPKSLRRNPHWCIPTKIRSTRWVRDTECSTQINETQPSLMHLNDLFTMTSVAFQWFVYYTQCHELNEASLTRDIHRRRRSMQYGMSTIRRLLKMMGFFCKRALWKRLYSAEETYNCEEATHRSPPIAVCCIVVCCSVLELQCVAGRVKYSRYIVTNYMCLSCLWIAHNSHELYVSFMSMSCTQQSRTICVFQQGI